LSANLGENKAIEKGRSGSGPRKARKSAGQRSGFLRSDRCRSWLILHFIWHFYEQLQPSPNLHFSKKPHCPAFLPPSPIYLLHLGVSVFQNVAISFALVSGFAFRHVFMPPIKLPHAATRTLRKIFSQLWKYI